MRSTDVDQVLSTMTRMFLCLSVTKTMTFGRSKTLPNILIWCLIAFDEINNLCDFLNFVEKLWIHPQTQNIMILSQVITYPMRVFGMVLKCSKGHTYYWLPLPLLQPHTTTTTISTRTYYWLPPSITTTITTTTTIFTYYWVPPPTTSSTYYWLQPLLPALHTTDFHHHHHYCSQ